MRFSKVANFANAPVIQQKNRCKDIPEPPAAHRAHTEPCPVKACFPPSSPQSPTESLPHQSLFPPQQPTEHFVLQSMVYIKTVKKTKSVKKLFTWLRLVLKKMRVLKVANLANAPIIHSYIWAQNEVLPPLFGNFSSFSLS